MNHKLNLVRNLIVAITSYVVQLNEFSRSDFSWNSYTSSYTTPTQISTQGVEKKAVKAHFYWVTREPGSVEWFRGVMEEISDMDFRVINNNISSISHHQLAYEILTYLFLFFMRQGQIELHNYLTSVYDEGDARSTLIKMVQALNHAKHGVDILSGTRVRRSVTYHQTNIMSQYYLTTNKL